MSDAPALAAPRPPFAPTFAVPRFSLPQGPASSVPPLPAAPGPGSGAGPALPVDFVTEAEHPTLPIPFTAQWGEERLRGTALSVAAATVALDGPPGPAWEPGRRAVAKLQFDFDGFSLTLFPEAVVAPARKPGEAALQFLDPAGAHLPQLRHVINSFIAGDLVSMGGLLSYSGPTKPKAARAEAPVGRGAQIGQRLRSATLALTSLTLIVAAAGLLLTRATQATEPRPVFIERMGQDMRATTAGQVAYLNPEAKAGEVVFSINANSGDVLNFQLPCTCEVAVTEGIFEGATVLPIDVILSFFESSLGVRVQTLMSVEGLARVMDGDRAYLDINDGRSIPVRVTLTSATTAAADRGDLFVPVSLVPEPGALSDADVGKAGRLRLARSWLPGSWPSLSEDS